MTASRTLLAFAALLAGLAAAPVRAQTPGACALGTAEGVLDASQVEATLFNTGSLFYGNQTEAGYRVPRYADRSPVYAAGLWLGGKVGGEVRTAAARYANFEFWPGPLDAGATLPNPADCSAYDRVWVVSTNDVAVYEATGQATPDLQEWPVGLGAEAIDASGNPVVVTSRAQTINLGVGERPVVYGSQTAFWVMNDVGNAHANTGTAPLGVEVQVVAWAIASADVVDFDRASFYRYRVINRGSAPIDSLIAALWVDPDLGDGQDDYVGVDTTRGLAFTYNADNNDSGWNGYGTPPAVGFDLLDAPLGAHMWFLSGSNVPTNDPSTAHGFHYVMQGRWTDGTPMTEGGMGYPPDGPVTTFAFPGDPVTDQFWSERNNGSGWNTPGDRRQVLAAQPRPLAPGDTLALTFAIVFGWGSDHLDSVTRLRAASDRVQAAHDDGSLFEPASIPPEVVLAGPDLLSPADGAVFYLEDATYAWTAVEGAARYALETSSSLDGPWRVQHYTDTTAATTRRLAPGGVEPFYWRVRAEAPRAVGTPSAPRQVTHFYYPTGPLPIDPSGSPDSYTNMAFVEITRPGGTPACEPGATRIGCREVGGDLIYQSFNSTSQWAGYHLGVSGPEASVGRAAPRELEIRFTEAGSYAAYAHGPGTLLRVPFEVWDIGLVHPFEANDPADDVRLIPTLEVSAGATAADPCAFEFAESLTIFGIGLTTPGIGAYYPAEGRTYADWAAYAAPLVGPTGCAPAPAGDSTAIAPYADLPRDRPMQRFIMEEAAGGTTSVADLVGSVIRFYTTNPPPRSVGTETPAAPGTFALGAAYPNPFASRLTVPFTAGAAGPVRVALYDVLGRRVAVLNEGERPAGPHRVAVETAGLAAGVYIVVLEGEGVRLTQRVVHLK